MGPSCESCDFGKTKGVREDRGEMFVMYVCVCVRECVRSNVFMCVENKDQNRTHVRIVFSCVYAKMRCLIKAIHNRLIDTHSHATTGMYREELLLLLRVVLPRSLCIWQTHNMPTNHVPTYNSITLSTRCACHNPSPHRRSRPTPTATHQRPVAVS